jgi:hypothetical protein
MDAVMFQSGLVECMGDVASTEKMDRYFRIDDYSGIGRISGCQVPTGPSIHSIPIISS